MNGTPWLLVEILIYGVMWSYLLGLVPALVVTALKDNGLLLLVGFLTFGLTWFIGAAGEAKPASWWAHRFYPGGLEPDSREMLDFLKRRRRRMLGLAATAFLLIGVLAARPTLVLGIDSESLQHSVGGGLVPFEERCKPRPGGEWTCYIYDSGLSGDMPYLTEVDWVGCWTARSVHTGRLAPSEKKLSGCVTIFDYVRPLSRILG